MSLKQLLKNKLTKAEEEINNAPHLEVHRTVQSTIIEIAAGVAVLLTWLLVIKANFDFDSVVIAASSTLICVLYLYRAYKPYKDEGPILSLTLISNLKQQRIIMHACRIVALCVSYAFMFGVAINVFEDSDDVSKSPLFIVAIILFIFAVTTGVVASVMHYMARK